MTSDHWVISGKPDTAVPEVGKKYKVIDMRQGEFVGVIESVDGDFATINVTEGKPRFMSDAYRLSYDGQTSVRNSLCYLIEL